MHNCRTRSKAACCRLKVKQRLVGGDTAYILYIEASTYCSCASPEVSRTFLCFGACGLTLLEFRHRCRNCKVRHENVFPDPTWLCVEDNKESRPIDNICALSCFGHASSAQIPNRSLSVSMAHRSASPDTPKAARSTGIKHDIFLRGPLRSQPAFIWVSASKDMGLMGHCSRLRGHSKVMAAIIPSTCDKRLIRG